MSIITNSPFNYNKNRGYDNIIDENSRNVLGYDFMNGYSHFHNKKRGYDDIIDEYSKEICNDSYLSRYELINRMYNLYPVAKKLKFYNSDNIPYTLIPNEYKYDIYEKEPEDKLNFYPNDDKIYENELIVDCNKLIITNKWENGINDEIKYLIDFYQIDILIIRKNNFNHPIECIPDRIKSIKIYSKDFNQPVDVLPKNLKVFCIKSCNKYDSVFNQSLNYLPTGLEDLVIVSRNFNQSLYFLPNTLKKLYIGNAVFNQSVDSLPNKLETLCISSLNFNQRLDNLPESLKTLFIEFPIKHINVLENLPSSLETLIYGFFVNPSNIFNFNIDNLPSSIKYLHFGRSFSGDINNLPDSIEHLLIGDEMSNITNKITKLPQNLKSIGISGFIENKTDLLNSDKINKLFEQIDLTKYDINSDINKFYNWEKLGGYCISLQN
jgi:hypothetical protein